MTGKSFIPAKALKARHLRMARAGLHFSIREFADLCHVNKATIVRIEAGHKVRDSTRTIVRQTLEDQGAEFWQCDGQGKIVVGINKS